MTKTIALLFLAASLVIAMSLIITGWIYKTKDNPEEHFKKYEIFFNTSLFVGLFAAVIAFTLMLIGFFFGNNLDIKDATAVPVVAFFAVLVIAFAPLLKKRSKSKEKQHEYIIVVKDQSSGKYFVSVKED
ncbi:MAG: hypothetical protein IBX50_09325 [Marinospirillum sp.]|uniref:hypothetical protein n=1 Tax=Marinospirillum sp. TaxID=2183934 RepID=UPI0019FDFB16|nr:hypothetical protein [Marinospirillum sp.]MBE0506902.1 hypothetical protein [Marinospirillum sp.]